MRALITGNKGFLGRHFETELKARGYEVTGLDIKTTSSQDCRTYFRYMTARDRMRPNLAGEWDLVVHCAAVIGGREVIDGNPLATAENLSIDAEMFRWAAVARPGRVLYLSSSAAYPAEYQQEPLTVSLKETHMVSGWDRPPDQIYGWSKVIGEVLAGELRRAGVPVTVVRPFSGYGTDQDLTYPFPAFIRRAKEGQDPFEVWCGSCVRDFIHVDDLVSGALAIAEDGTTDPVNLCTGEPTSFNELAEMVMGETWGSSVPIRELSDKPTGVAYRVGDPARMLSIFEPKITLEEGIRRALAGTI